MKNSTLRSLLMTASFTAALALSACARNSEVVVPMESIPPAVQVTIAANSAGYKVDKVEKETTDGKVEYEAKAFKSNGMRRVIKVSEDGSLVRVIKKSAEEKVSWKHVPKAVQKTMTTAAGGKKISKTEKETVDGVLVYEGKVMNDDGSKLVIKVGKDGTLISSKVHKD